MKSNYSFASVRNFGMLQETVARMFVNFKKHTL